MSDTDAFEVESQTSPEEADAEEEEAASEQSEEAEFEAVGETPADVPTSYDELDTLLHDPAELADEAHQRYMAGDYAAAIPLLLARRERLTDLNALALTDYNLALSYAHLGHHEQCAYWIERYLEQAYGDQGLRDATDVSGPRYAFVLYYAAKTGRALPPPKDL